MEIRDIIPNLNREVEFDKSIYVMKKSTIWKDANGNLHYSGVLVDKNQNSLCEVDIKNINKLEN